MACNVIDIYDDYLNHTKLTPLNNVCALLFNALGHREVSDIFVANVFST